MTERLEAIVSGRVQMVMFRDFTQRKATGLHVTGEVKNVSDGTVAVTAEGPRASLETLLTKLQRGSLLSHVENIDVKWAPATGSFKKFSITYE
ncbi:MAG: acylphosphatase [Patescibacteria group bacterium]